MLMVSSIFPPFLGEVVGVVESLDEIPDSQVHFANCIGLGVVDAGQFVNANIRTITCW